MSSFQPKKPVKIAIVGTGLIGPRHADAVIAEPDAELVAIVDPSPAAEAVARRLKCPLYKSVEDMLAVSPPEGALVCTPNHTHVPISKVLLEGGVHVLCEKPISVDVASGDELVRVSNIKYPVLQTDQEEVKCAEAHARQLLIGHHRRFNRYVVATKKALPSLGKIVAVNGLWAIYKPPEYFNAPTEWRRLDSAGPILINLIHEIDILHHWFGPIVRVYAEGATSDRGYAAEEGAAITLRFANGVVGTFLLSDAVVSPHNFESGTGENPTIPKTGCDSYRIFGSEGCLSFPDMLHWSYTGNRSWNETMECKHLEVPETKVPFELQVEHFVKVVRSEEAPSCSGADGLRAVVVCDAIRRSMREQVPVNIPE